MLRVGVDESGTGAWAGPYTVTACMIGEDFEEKIGVKLNDSKKLSDKRRRELVPLILEHAVAVHTTLVTVPQIEASHRGSWREAIFYGVRALGVPTNREANIMIDGPTDKGLAKWFKHEKIPVKFESKADANYIEVMAASIIAKTVRNDAMIALSESFPEFEWATNAGYGTPKHLAAIREHGRTVHHRPIRTIADVTKTYGAKEWFG